MTNEKKNHNPHLEDKSHMVEIREIKNHMGDLQYFNLTKEDHLIVVGIHTIHILGHPTEIMDLRVTIIMQEEILCINNINININININNTNINNTNTNT